jgi:hypothetical protein
MTWCGILKSGEDRVITIKTSRVKGPNNLSDDNDSMQHTKPFEG